MTNEILSNVFVFNGESFELCDTLLKQRIEKVYYIRGSRVITSLLTRGIKTYGDLPRDLAELIECDGASPNTVQYMSKVMRKLDNQIRWHTYHDKGSLENEYVEFEKWLLTESHLEPCRLSPRFTRILKEKHLAAIEERNVTLKLIGELEGVSPERVRQIIVHSGYKLRRHVSDDYPRIAEEIRESEDSKD
ncbi:hypothetical protein RYX56_06430 [Alkalihalophilus lindianensis]|uniref:RNA polymerase sigma-70 region 4 domain-containing protein n=1 Tax=Alkalihalophilus lindianensis TaxID=1630542 RepID=A0ABU3X7Z5_9BACI|nr:hypothetical protein [Alkalihalophilus lindianensis]MDV2684008.1 hypothetical protein [Alkalihalophilus lindianensis]